MKRELEFARTCRFCVNGACIFPYATQQDKQPSGAVNPNIASTHSLQHSRLTCSSVNHVPPSELKLLSKLQRTCDSYQPRKS